MKKENQVLLFGLATGLTTTIFPFIVGEFIKFSEIMGEVNIIYLAIMLISLVSTPILRYIFNIRIAKAEASYRKDTKNNLLHNLFSKNNLQNDEEIIDLVDGDVDGSIYLKYRRIFDISTNGSIILLSFLALIYFNVWLTVPPCLAIFVTILLFNFSKKSSNRSYSKYIDLNTNFLGIISNAINQDQKIDVSQYENQCLEIIKNSFKANLLNSIYSNLASFSYIVGISALGLVGYLLVSKFSSGIGEIIATAIFVERILLPVNTLTRIFYETREAKARLTRIKKNNLEDFELA